MKSSTIGPIAELTGRHLARLIWALQDESLVMVEIAVNEDGLRVCVDGGVWSPPLGRLVAK